MSSLVTGTPGSGKTTLVKYAEKLADKRFVDADEIPGLCEWRKFDTGSAVGLVSEVTIGNDDEWYKKHGWYWRTDRLNEFLKANPDKILCGSSENIDECFEHFDRIIILVKTEAELLKNLQSAERQNPFGKNTKQRAGFIEWQDYLIQEAQSYSTLHIKTNNIAEAYQEVFTFVEINKVELRNNY